MDFFKYPRIENFKEAYIHNLIGDVVFLEKIHGSNFQFTFIFSNGTVEMKVGKKSSYMDKKEYIKFYGAGSVVNRYSESLHKLANNLHTIFCDNDETFTVRFFGELYGGFYNHITNGVRVQRGVDYCPTNEFAVFDIYATGKVLSWDEVKKYCDEYSVPRVPEMARGRMTELFKTFDLNNQISCVPKEMHGLTEVENPAFEGVIIRPVIEGSCDRVKWKQEWIVENPPTKPNVPNEDSEMFQYYLDFLNEARFSNFCSKTSPDDILNMKMMGTNIKALVGDVFESIDKECPDMEKDFRNKLRKPISVRAKNMIMNYVPPLMSDEEKLSNIELSFNELSVKLMFIQECILKVNSKMDSM